MNCEELCSSVDFCTETMLRKTGIEKLKERFLKEGYLLEKSGRGKNSDYSLQKTKYRLDFENIKEINGYKKRWIGETEKNNLTGQVFDRLEVLYKTDKPETAKTSKSNFWLCRCKKDGNYIVTSANSLMSGTATSCGCKRIETQIKNNNIRIEEGYIGKKINHLTILRRLPNKKGQVVVECQCDCKEKTILPVFLANLKNNHTTSCGCSWKDYYDENYDLIGQKFGHLTVIERQGSNNKRQSLWKCECDCKEKTIKEKIPGIYLRNGSIISCGCEKSSKGELEIASILTEHNILFNREFSFNNNAKYPTSIPMKFDFYLLDYNTLIEYDGVQHFEAIDYFGGQNTLKNQQKRDILKNQWCKDNNISLIRIPYWHLNNICLKDLLPETSSFIVKEKESI